MLDIETRRRIDTCRDILVGKVPDPKGQVEQITIALIYKFMDDMDKQSIEMGGKAAFFAGEFAKYSWSAIFDPRIGGNEQLILYAEALTKLNENPKIPQLFRDIFKNAFLPYRDPETLRSFLKEINKFSYDHSERLGDAFEYLLSVLSSQGDAGQFRTPRHIIDFIVKVIDPKPTETILDPACGTAGFLISAYKHILKQNQKLSASQKKRLMSNFIGYDISYDMVRLSLVNMYLHSFPEPHIYEYDTLTSESRWNESADVIMANPPFMSPKGGIKPHKRFSIQAKRSEVLFVDYIAEHLNPGGRAGVIVPEGIIFQSGSAYKQLREMLVENYLWAVVSLPSGVFNPYSGVKTSILFMDKHMSKNTDSILFVKVENDGFDLGAQRREIDKNDLPDAINVLADYIQAVQSGKLKSFKSDQKPCSTLLVSKKKLAENGDYNLTVDRYRTTERKIHQKWPMVKLGEVCEINPKKAEVSLMNMNMMVSFVPMEDVDTTQYVVPQKEKSLGEVYKGYTYFRDNDVLVAKVTPCFENGKSGIAQGLKNGIGFGSSELHVIRPSKLLLPEFVYRFIASDNFLSGGKTKMTGTGGLQRVPSQYVSDFQFPLPPIEVQREIVAEIEGYQKIIDGARQVVDNWKPQIEINPDWPLVELRFVCNITCGFAFKSENLLKNQPDNSYLPVVKIGSFDHRGQLSATEYEYHKYFDELEKYIIHRGDIIIAMTGATVGKTAISQGDKFLLNQRVGLIRCNDKSTQEFLKYVLYSDSFYEYCQRTAGGGAQGNISPKYILDFKMYLPSIKEQNEIVAKIEVEQKVVEGCKELINLYEAKIKNVIDKV